ncbi:MAG: helix-turn-helix domain-containing protein [Bacillota bacterium]|nr:helix-turn-helix domain-containing protein [Bacillota bacterium]
MAISEQKMTQCPLEYTLGYIGGKWKMVILWRLSGDCVMRYSEIKKKVSQISHKMLSQQLKELENDRLITRTDYHQIPPRVEYSLTNRGISLIPLLKSAFEWGQHDFYSQTTDNDFNSQRKVSKQK